jgi:hypothetical protein
MLALWASTPGGKPAAVGLDATAAGTGEAWAGFWPAGHWRAAPALRYKEQPCVCVPIRVNGTWIDVFCRLQPQ